MFAKIQRIHFVGIGGIGMSGIAEVLLNLGYRISGSDVKLSAITERLAGMGATIYEGHQAANVGGARALVVSSAVDEQNPEVVEARRLGIPVIARGGRSDFLLVESDESDGSFLKLAPIVAVVTNIDREHLDHYPSLDAIRAAFIEFVNKVPFYGAAIVCLDDPNVQGILPEIRRRTITYGTSSQSDLEATEIACGPFNSDSRLRFRTTDLGPFHLG